MFEFRQHVIKEIEDLRVEVKELIELNKTRLHEFSRSDAYFSMPYGKRLRIDSTYSIMTLFEIVLIQNAEDYKRYRNQKSYLSKRNLITVRDNLRAAKEDINDAISKLPDLE